MEIDGITPALGATVPLQGQRCAWSLGPSAWVGVSSDPRAQGAEQRGSLSRTITSNPFTLRQPVSIPNLKAGTWGLAGTHCLWPRLVLPPRGERFGPRGITKPGLCSLGLTRKSPRPGSRVLSYPSSSSGCQVPASQRLPSPPVKSICNEPAPSVRTLSAIPDRQVCC